MSMTEEDEIRAIERERLRALVAADMDVAGQLHADDFQLVTPSGSTYSKEEYLGRVASGVFNYLIWEPDSPIEVRLYGQAAVIRYRSHLEGIMRGEPMELARYWHLDVYERRDGRWQVVWSQATQIS
jgi:ketosteroid isomerase-like protein